MVAKSRDAASELAANLVRVLESQRSLGSSAYPLSLRRLAELTDASAPPEPLQPALKKKPFKDRVVCGHTKHPNAPVAFVEDLDQLAASPLLLEFALEQLCTQTSPTCTVTKLKAQVPPKLRPKFEAAVNRRIQENTLPESVAVILVKKKPQLHLRRYELPRPPEEELAENLLRVLRAQRALGDGAYPLSLRRLLELTDPDAPEEIRKKALAWPAFKEAVVLGLSVKDSLKSPIALMEDIELLAESPLLFETALREKRTGDNQILSVADLKRNVAPAVRPFMERSLHRKVQARSLPPTVGCLLQRKKPVFFLISDVSGSKAGPVETPTACDGTVHPAAAAGRADFAHLFDEAFHRLEANQRTGNYVSLKDLRAALPAFDRVTFDAELCKLREARLYTLSAAEGRLGITREEQEAGIVEDGALLLHVSRRLP
jgi:hypothetical protein